MSTEYKPLADLLAGRPIARSAALALDPDTPVSTIVALAELGAERVRAIAKGYDAAHDDRRTLGELWDHLVDCANSADADAGRADSNDREMALKAGQFALAILESVERRRHAAGIDQAAANLRGGDDGRPCSEN